MGTRIHEALEVRDPSGLESELEYEIYEQCDKAEASLVAQYFDGEDFEKHVELPVPIPLNSGRSIWGTGDVLYMSKCGTRGLAIDYKTGRMQVDSADVNLQARAYKNGYYSKWPQLEELRFAFLAPQLDWISVHDFHPESVDLDRLEITQIVAKAEVTLEKWALGEVEADDVSPCDYCQWCRHQTYCPALHGLTVDFAKSTKMEVPGEFNEIDLTNPEVAAKWYTLAKTIEPIIAHIKSSVVELGKDGEILPGWDLRSMGAKRITKDNRGFVEFAQEYGVTVEDIIDLANIPIAQVRKIVSERAARGQKAKISSEFEEDGIDRGLIQKGTERFTLKAITDDDA
jgi:hypothetical protein